MECRAVLIGAGSVQECGGTETRSLDHKTELIECLAAHVIVNRPQICVVDSSLSHALLEGGWGGETIPFTIIFRKPKKVSRYRY